MSTILKALRQLEDERTRANAAADPLTDAQLAAPLEPQAVTPGWQRWQAALLAGVGGALLASALVLAWLPDGEEAGRPGSRLSPVSAAEHAAAESGAKPSAAVPAAERRGTGAPLRADGGLAAAAGRSAGEESGQAASAPDRVVAVFGANSLAAENTETVRAPQPPIVDAPVQRSAKAREAAPEVAGARSSERLTSAPRVAAARAAETRIADVAPRVARSRNSAAPVAESPAVASRNEGLSNGETSVSTRRDTARRAANSVVDAARDAEATTLARAARVRAPAPAVDPASEGAETTRVRPPAGSTRPARKPVKARAPQAAEFGAAPNVADLEPMIPDFARSRRSGAATPVVVSSTVWHPVASRRTANVVVEPGTAPREVREGEQVGSLVVLEITPSGIVFEEEGVRLTRRVGAGS